MHVQEKIFATTAAESAAAEVWCQVLGLQQVGLTDDFFQLGGTSLTAIRLAHRMSERLGLQISIADVFQHRTICALLQAQLGSRTEAAAEVWCRVLGLQNVGLKDDFFQLGGTSLTAIRLAHRLSERLGLQISVTDVFQHRTISALLQAQLGSRTGAAAEEGKCSSAANTGLCSARAPKLVACDWSNTSVRPLSYQQVQLFSLHRAGLSPVNYNEMLVWQFEGGLDAAVLQQALGLITDRHEVLRTALQAAPDGSFYGHVLPPGSVSVPVIVKQAACSSSLDQWMQSENQPFDLGQPPLMRATLVLPPAKGTAAAANPSLLLLVVHHVAVDGISMGLLCAELTCTYNALKAGGEVALVAPKVCSRDGATFSWSKQFRGLLFWAATMLLIQGG